MGAIEDLEELQRHNFFFTQESWNKPQINNTIKVHRQLDGIANMIEALKLVVKYEVNIADAITYDTYEEYVESVKEFFDKVCEKDTKERREKVTKSWTMSEEDFYFVHEQLKEVDDYILKHWRDNTWKNQKLIDKWILEMERNER